MTDFRIEDQHPGVVAGVDEAGRGPWAGPVVAAAVILDRQNFPAGLNDSKQLGAGARERLHDAIIATARHGIGLASVAEIDALNIHWATMLAMERAVDALGAALGAALEASLEASVGAIPDHVLVDGNRLPRWTHRATAIVKGDTLSCSIAAASILAKVTRDRLMAGLDAECPGYGWAANKGYGTAAHARGLAALGVTVHHRRSFAPVKARLNLSP